MSGLQDHDRAMTDHPLAFLAASGAGAPAAPDIERLAAQVEQIRSVLERMDPISRELLARLLHQTEPETEPSASPEDDLRRTFGRFKGAFAIGPEFFEPLPDEELRAWGEI